MNNIIIGFKDFLEFIGLLPIDYFTWSNFFQFIGGLLTAFILMSLLGLVCLLITIIIEIIVK